jgi:hypothetical protein
MSGKALVVSGALATLGVTAGTAVAASSGATSTTTAPGACRTTNMTIWRAAPGSGTTGGTYYDLEFSNTGSASCSLTGYPRVIAVDSHGQQIGRSAGHDDRFAPSTVVVGRGRTAHAVIRVTDVGVFSAATCDPTPAAGLKVFPPGRPLGVVVPLRFTACAATGPSFLSVRVIRPLAGIPDFSQ